MTEKRYETLALRHTDHQPKPDGLHLRPLNRAEIDRRFDYHAPSGMAKDMHGSMRAAAKEFALTLTNLPDGREKALAFTAFEEATFWAHAAIAREPALHEPES